MPDMTVSTLSSKVYMLISPKSFALHLLIMKEMYFDSQERRDDKQRESHVGKSQSRYNQSLVTPCGSAIAFVNAGLSQTALAPAALFVAFCAVRS
jgi:hypothetical protein